MSESLSLVQMRERLEDAVGAYEDGENRECGEAVKRVLVALDASPSAADVEAAARVLQRRFEGTGDDHEERRAWDEIDAEAQDAYRADSRAALSAVWGNQEEKLDAT